MSMVHVLAVITAKPGRRDDILTAFRANVPAVHAEDGCIEYGATIDTEGVGNLQTQFGEDSFVVVEKWANLAALEGHIVAPLSSAEGAKTKDMIASRIIHVLSPV